MLLRGWGYGLQKPLCLGKGTKKPAARTGPASAAGGNAKGRLLNAATHEKQMRQAEPLAPLKKGRNPYLTGESARQHELDSSTARQLDSGPSSEQTLRVCCQPPAQASAEPKQAQLSRVIQTKGIGVLGGNGWGNRANPM